MSIIYETAEIKFELNIIIVWCVNADIVVNDPKKPIIKINPANSMGRFKELTILFKTTTPTKLKVAHETLNLVKKLVILFLGIWGWIKGHQKVSPKAVKRK